MGYLHIENLYRPEAQTILLFRECREARTAISRKTAELFKTRLAAKGDG